MPDRKQDKRVLVDVQKMDEEELDAAIDSALDELFGSDHKPQKKEPIRRKKTGRLKQSAEPPEKE